MKFTLGILVLGLLATTITGQISAQTAHTLSQQYHRIVPDALLATKVLRGTPWNRSGIPTNRGLFPGTFHSSPMDRVLNEHGQFGQGVFHEPLSPQEDLVIIDSVIAVSNYRGTTKHLYTYDPEGRMTSHLSKQLVEGIWADSSRTTYTRDAGGLVLSYLKEEFVEGGWKEVARWNGTYNANGQKTEELFERWLGDQWHMYFYGAYRYDAEGRIDSQYQKSRGPGFNEWRTDSRSFSYDSSGLLLSLLGGDSSPWGASRWRSIYTYDANRRVAARSDTYWWEGQWTDGGGFRYTYDDYGNVLTVDTHESWYDEGQYTPLAHYTYTYDANGRILTFLHEWTPDWEKWLAFIRHTYTYNAAGNILTQEFELAPDWDGVLQKMGREVNMYDVQERVASFKAYRWTDSTWVHQDPGVWTLPIAPDTLGGAYGYFGYDVTVAYNLTATNVGAEETTIPASHSLSQNYPNPFNPTTTIRYALPERSHVTLTVYNMLGQEIATLVNGEVEAGNHTVKFNASDLASGMYFYRIQAGTFVDTKKLLLVR